jgi:protease-4
MRRLIAVVFVLLVALVIGVALLGTGPDIPDRAALVIELEGELEEAPGMDPVARLLASGPALPTLLLQLDKAAYDTRVVGVLLHVRALRIPWAQIQELRGAIERVRAAGKSVVALLDLQQLNATREIYLASAADRVLVAPGYLGPVLGIAGEYLFLGGMLEKVGVQVEYERIGRYKSAPESLADRSMSAPAREMTDALLDGLFEQILEGIARGRALRPERVREIVDLGPSTAADLVANGLADAVAGREKALEAGGLDAKEVPYEDYLPVDPQDLGLRDGPAVAVIFGSGSIVSTEGRGPRRNSFSSRRISRTLRDAADDEKIRAIVLRIDSSGGSSLASEELWRAVRDARRRKPVVVSMGTMAASGGYYVASAADAIVAEPSTLTGSIGIFIQRPLLRGLYEKLEVGVELFTRGKYASAATSSQPLTEEQRALSQHFLQSLYDDFVARVAEGRGIAAERTRELGEGRVYLGASARELGLVDELGGLHEAVARAKQAAGIAAEEDPERVVLPGPRSWTEQIQDLTQGAAASWVAGAWLGWRVPAAVHAWLELQPGEIAYLPAHWIELQ